MSFYTNQVEKAINLIWSQNDAYISYGLIHIHYRLNLGGVITFLPMVYYVGFHIGYIKSFAQDSQVEAQHCQVIWPTIL
jgi:hypothetical protein